MNELILEGFKDELQKLAGKEESARKLYSTLLSIAAPAAVTGAVGTGIGAMAGDEESRGKAMAIGGLIGGALGAAPGALYHLLAKNPLFVENLLLNRASSAALGAMPATVAGAGMGASLGVLTGDESNRARRALIGGLLGGVAAGIPAGRSFDRILYPSPVR